MIQSRGFKIVFFLSMSIMAFGSILYITGLDTTPKIISVSVGGILGILTCVFSPLSHTRLSSADSSRRIDRWMLPTVVGSVILARVVTETFEPEIQDIALNFVSAWITIFFTYSAIWFWRHKEVS